METQTNISISYLRVIKLTGVILGLITILFIVGFIFIQGNQLFYIEPNYPAPDDKVLFTAYPWANRTAIKEIQRKVSTSLKYSQTIQIFHPDIAAEKMTLKTKLGDIIKQEQTDNVMRKGSCAIVGNSGILLDSACGDVIDNVDYVIRINAAPFGNEYAADVGSRVDLMTINVAQLRSLNNCTNNPNVAFANLSLGCKDLITRLKYVNESVLWYFKSISNFNNIKRVLIELRNHHNIHLTFAYSPANPMRPASRIWKMGFPSSGLAVYTAATQFCVGISLFGFYPFYQDRNNQTLTHHYYEATKINYTTNAHDMIDEFRILTDLDHIGAIRLINNCTSAG